MSGQDITFNVNGQPVAGYLALPSVPDAPGVIVLHAWWGLNPIFKRLCERLASEGFAAFAPDLLNGKVARTIDEAKQFMPENEVEQVGPIAAAAPGVLRARSEVRNGPLSVIGFSMGATWALVLASEQPEVIRKVVLFYGIYEGMDVSNIRADVLGNFADRDEWESMDGIRATERDLRHVGLSPTFHFYLNTKHWFFEEDRPEYDPQAAALAWRRTLEFLRG